MTSATGEHSIAELSRRDVVPLNRTTRQGVDRQQLLTGEPRPIPFSINFPSGESVEVTLVRNGEEPSAHWLVFGALQRMARLAACWDSYSARPLSPKAVWRSVGLLTTLVPANAPEPTIVPTRDGGVQFEWHRRGIDIEVTIPPVGEVSYMVADSEDEQEGEGIPDRGILGSAFARMSAA